MPGRLESLPRRLMPRRPRRCETIGQIVERGGHGRARSPDLDCVHGFTALRVRESFTHMKGHTMKTATASILFSLAALSAGAQAADAAHDASYYGGAATANAAERTIVVKPGARWVNVKNGETVAFVVGDQRFAYHFETYPQTQVVTLDRIAPAGVQVAPVRVYIADTREVNG
jgi:hypothetical protein